MGKRYGIIATLPLVIVAAALACGEAAAPPAPTTVTIGDNFFSPRDITVALGTTVRWVNEGAVLHDVTQFEAEFMRDAIGPGEQFEHTFTNTGLFEYACGRHAGMQGSVVVE